MKRILMLCLVFLLCANMVGCDIGAILGQTQMPVVISEYQDSQADTTTTSATYKSSSKTPTSSVTTTSKVSSVISTDFVVSEITTFDGEKAVEITVNKNEPSESDDNTNQDPTPSVAIPPSIEDLNNLLGDSAIEPEISDSVSDEQSSSSEQDKPNDNTNDDNQHTPVGYEYRYRYTLLSQNEKEAYRLIVKSAEDIKYRVDFVQPLTFSSVATVIDAVIADNPQFFYLCTSCTVIHDGNEKARAVCLKFSDSVNTNTDSEGYCIEVSGTLKSNILAKKTAFDAKTKSILSKIDPNLPEVVKEKIIYDTILQNADYNTNAQWTKAIPNDWTAYGVLVNSKGVCESYSEAFQHLCLMAGINCTIVRGNAGGAHQWNAVLLDDEWYECDITFDDPLNAFMVIVYHNYFNLTSQRMLELNHVVDPNEPAPIATGTKYSYKNYFNN